MFLTIRKFSSIINKDIKLKLFGLIIVVAANSYLSSFLSVKLGALYDDISSGKIASISQGFIPVLFYALICILSTGMDIFRYSALQKVICKNEANLKSKGVEKILKNKVSYHSECLSGERSTQVFRGVFALSECLRIIVNEMFYTTFLVIFSLTQLLMLAPIQMTIVTLIYIVIFAIASTAYVKILKGVRKQVIDLGNEFSGKSTQTIQNIEFIRAINAFGFEKNRLDKNIRELYEKDKEAIYLWSIFEWIKRVVKILSFTALIFLSCYFIGEDTFKPGSAIAVCLLFDKIVSHTWPISYFLTHFSSSIIEANKLVELLNNEEDKTLNLNNNESKVCDVKSDNQFIVFNNVQVFTPKNDKVIGKYKNIVIDTNKITALKGVTGAGKTTLIRALLRYYPSNTDNILVFGKPLSQYSHKELTDSIYYVTQNAFFFLGTIRENLIYGLDKDIDDAKLISVLKKMCLVSDINHSEKGQEIESEDKILDYKLQEGASNLSGGQRQRLSIARALLRAPKLFIFDESSANIDSVTADKILTNIEDYAQSIGAGIVYISHDKNVTSRCSENIMIVNEVNQASLVNF